LQKKRFPRFHVNIEHKDCKIKKYFAKKTANKKKLRKKVHFWVMLKFS